MTPELINGLFAIGGALVGVFGAWLVARSQRKTKRLTIFQSPIAKLLDVSDLVKSDVKITFKEKSVSALGVGELALQNTGSDVVENIELDICAGENSEIIDLEIKSTNFGAVNSQLTLSRENGVFRVNTPFFNPSDRVVLEFRIIGDLNKPKSEIRLKGVELNVKEEMVSWLPDIYAEVVFELFSKMPLFGFAFKFVKPMRLYLESKRNQSGESSNR